MNKVLKSWVINMEIEDRMRRDGRLLPATSLQFRDVHKLVPHAKSAIARLMSGTHYDQLSVLEVQALRRAADLAGRKVA